MKKILTLIFIVFGLVGVGSAYFQDKLFCEVDGKYIKVSLSSKEGYNCQEYIATIDHSIRGVYKDLITVQSYIFKKQDVEYRSTIKQQKLDSFNQLQSLRASILLRMQTFEENLFKKIKEYLFIYVDTYSDELRSIQRKFNKLGTGVVLSDKLYTYSILLEKQINLIEDMFNSKNFEELMPYLPEYIKTKKALNAIK